MVTGCASCLSEGMGRVVHFEIPVDDPERAQAFYADVFGWNIAGWGEMPYWLATTGEEGTAGIDGALIARSDLHAAPVLVVAVESVEAALTAAESAGATIMHGREEIPGVGWSAYVRDTEDNVVGLFEPLPGDG